MKRLIVLLIVALMVCSVFTACAKPATPTETPETTEAVVAEEPTATPAEKEPVHLVFMHWKDAQGPKDALDLIFQEFTAKYPYITIEQQGMSPDQFNTTMKAKIASGDMPDIFTVGVEIADAGLCLNLADQAFLTNINADTINASNMMFKGYKDNGDIYAIPLDNSCIGIYVNKQVLADNGLTVPRTLSEMKTTCDALVAKGIAPFSAGYKDNWTAMMPLIGMYASTVYANVPDWDDQRDADAVSIATDANWKLAFDLYREYIYGYVNQKTAFDVDYNGSISQFVQGEAAFLDNGLWALQPIRAAAPDLDMDFIPFPVSDVASENKLLVFRDTTIAGSNQSKHPEEVMLFLEFMTSKFAGDTWTKYAQIGSPVIGTSADYDPIAPVIQKYIDDNQFVTHGDRLFRAIFNTALWDNNMSYLLGESSWEDLAIKLDTAWDLALEESKK
jgi:ABC-type glycerol-3-phosphate transport system substrate-binding protein